MTSAPASAAMRASRAFPTLAKTVRPPALARVIAEGSKPQKNDTPCTFLAMHISKCSSYGKDTFRFTAKFRSVRARSSSIPVLTCSFVLPQSGMTPYPPALQTAATKSGPAAPAIGADNIGFSVRRTSKRLVLIAFLQHYGVLGAGSVGVSIYVNRQVRSSVHCIILVNEGFLTKPGAGQYRVSLMNDTNCKQMLDRQYECRLF